MIVSHLQRYGERAGLVRGEVIKLTSILVPYSISIWCGSAVLGER